MKLKTESIKDRTRFWERAKKFLSSKLVVFIALLSLSVGAFTVVNRPSADDINFSRVYQYYLLSNSNGQDLAKASTETSQNGGDSNSGGSSVGKKLVGLLGNGGNQGSFSYNDIIQGADSKPDARKFSEIMATLSGYNYISVQNNGMSKILDICIHGLVGIPLIILGFFVDILSLFWTGIVNVIAQYNIFNLLGTAFGYSKTGDQMIKAMGMNSEDVKNWISMGLWIFTAVMIFTVVWALRRGGTNVSERDKHKVIGRAIGLIGIPVVICMSCSVLSDITELSDNSNPSEDPVFASWLMDTESWAKRYNFDITVGGIGKGINSYFSNSNSGAKGSNGPHGNYVDPNFNPYDNSKPADKIGKELYQQGLDESKTKFPNSTIAMSYLLSQTFDSRDYLDYISSNDINNLVSGFPNSKLYDFDKSYDSNGTEQKNWPAPSGIKKAKDDYYMGDLKKDPKYKATPIQTWEDRYIFGAKNTGNLAKYYKEQPSLEQVYSSRGGAGSNSDDRLTDESTFLALNTSFDTEGGDFSIDGPTYGAYATISKFDSNRYAYYKYSMVGNPLFTIPAMTVNGLLSLLVGLAVISALWSVGIIDMNLRPLRSWIKSISFGDIEYAEATMVYALGIAATALTVTLVPSVLVNVFTAIANMLGSLLTGNPANANSGGTTVVASEMIGTSYWVGFAFAVFGLVAYYHNWNGFRDKLVNLLLIPWDWAKGKGTELEAAAGRETNSALSRGRQATKDQLQKKRDLKNNLLEDLSQNETGLGKGLNNLTHGLSGDAATKALEGRALRGDYALDNVGHDPFKTTKELTMDAIRNRGVSRRQAAREHELAANVKSPESIERDFDQNATPDKALNEENLMDKDGQMNPDNPYVTPDDQKDMDQVNNDLGKLADDGLTEAAILTGAAKGLTPDEQKQLDDNHDMQDKVLGKKGADDYRNLQHKLAQGEPLTAAEQARLDGYNDKLQNAQQGAEESALGANAYKDYQDLKQKQANGEPLTEDEQKRLNQYDKKIQQAQEAHNEEVLGPKNYQDYKDLKQKQESGQPLTTAEQQRLDKYERKLKANPMSTQQALGANAYKDYQDLKQKQANGEPLTPDEQKRLNQYDKNIQQAQEAHNEEVLGPKDYQDYKDLKSKQESGQPLTTAEQQRLNKYERKLKANPMSTQQALGATAHKDYQQLAKKVASGQKLTPDEQQRYNQYRKSMKLQGVDPDGIKGMDTLEQKAAPILTEHEMEAENALQEQAGTILGDAGLQTYQQLQQKVVAGQPLTQDEQQKLDGFNKKLVSGGMKPAQIKKFNNLQSKSDNGLSVSQNKAYQTLMKKGAQASGMNERAMQDFAQLSRKSVKGELTDAEKKKLANYTRKLEKSMSPADVKHLQKLAGRRITGRLDPKQMKQYQMLQNKHIMSTRGIANLSSGQRTQLEQFNMKRDDVVRQQAPELMGKIQRYENMQGELTAPQMNEYRSLKRQARTIADSSMKPTELKQYRRLNTMAHPRLANGTSSVMTKGEQAQYKNLRSKITSGMTNSERARVNRLARQTQDSANKIAAKKAQIIQNVQDTNHINAARQKALKDVHEINRQLQAMHQATLNLSSHGTPRDADQITKAYSNLLSTSQGNPQLHQKVVAAAKNYYNDMKGFEFVAPGSIDTNGDGQINALDAGGYYGNQSNGKDAGKYYNSMAELREKLDSGHINTLDTEDRFSGQPEGGSTSKQRNSLNELRNKLDDGLK